METKDYIAKNAEHIERRLSELIPDNHQEPHGNLFTGARYSLLGGGKRLRPVLTLAVCETFGASPEKALSTACAIEMIHTYSLIHDDLPCMDNDDFRRGKPSLHKVQSEGHAVLAGDFLLTHAFDVIANDAHLTPHQKVDIIALLSRCAGGEGMIGGQVMDIEAEGKAITLDRLKQIHRLKTGAMISASILCGAIIAEVSSDKRNILRDLSEDLGLAFQIVDDILDVTASEKKHGKAISSDETKGKTTYVTLLGIEGARQAAQHLLDKALISLEGLKPETKYLGDIASLLVNRAF